MCVRVCVCVCVNYEREKGVNERVKERGRADGGKGRSE